MIRLVKTDRKPNFSGVTPAFAAGATLFFFTVLSAYFLGRHYQTNLVPCVFRIVTGEPCFLCGGTRASLNLASGHPLTAMKFNPLVTLVLCYVTIALILKFVFSRKLTFTAPALDRRFLWTATITIVLANWIYIVLTLP